MKTTRFLWCALVAALGLWAIAFYFEQSGGRRDISFDDRIAQLEEDAEDNIIFGDAGAFQNIPDAALPEAEPLPEAEDNEEQIEPVKIAVSGPFHHENLSIYLIHGRDRIADRPLVMLPDAMKQGKIVVHETQAVNQLLVENKSEEEVVILSGDVLKGGQQDRVVQYDMVLPPNSGKIPLAAFCVEQTAKRWMSDIDESDSTFSDSYDNISNYSAFNSAGRMSGSQTEVWQSVEKFQEQMRNKLNRSVRSPESVSSLQLSLNHADVRKASEAYTAKLIKAINGKSDVLGYAFVINGEIHGVDVYASNALFRKAWPRMLRTNAVEAFAKADPDLPRDVVPNDLIRKFVAAAETGKSTRQRVGPQFFHYRQQTEEVILFEAAENNRFGWIRRQYVPVRAVAGEAADE